MHAQADRGGQPFGRDQQRRQRRRPAPRPVRARHWRAASGIGRVSRQRMLRHSRSITSAIVVPSARAEKLSAMRWRSTGWASATTSSTRGREAAVDQRARAHRQHEGLAGARAGAPGDEIAQARHRRRRRAAPRAPACRIASTTFSPTGRRRTMACASIRSSGVQTGCDRRFLAEGGGEQHLLFGFAVGIADIDLQQEAVELRFGQRIGAFLLQRVLRRQHMEGLGQIVARARHRHMRSCIACSSADCVRGRGAVDFVGHQKLGEDRALDEAEGARAARRLLPALRSR